jgi:hypothetical protein
LPIADFARWLREVARQADLTRYRKQLACGPGYDADAKLWLAPRGLDCADIPERPTREEVTEAVALLDELLCDFPFADRAAKANALALILLPYVRPMIAGPTPLHLINAPAPGTGKDLLAQLAAVLATGRPCGTKSESHTEEEWRKNLTSWLVAGCPFAYLENINYALNSATFAKCLTGTMHRDRALGFNDKEYELPIRCVWVGTGNNVMMSGELARRVVEIRIDANCENPSQREGFRHRLPDWAVENRSQLVRACLVLIRAWVAAGMPKQPPRQIGSFEAWAEVMGGILHVAGAPGFLSNWSAVLEDVNSTEGEWAEFVLAWYGQFAERAVTCSELYQTVCEYTGKLGSVFRHDSKASGANQLGFALSRKKGAVVAGYKVEHRPAGSSHDKIGRWQLKPVHTGPGDSTRDSTRTEDSTRDSTRTQNAEKPSPEAPVRVLAGGCGYFSTTYARPIPEKEPGIPPPDTRMENDSDKYPQVPASTRTPPEVGAATDPAEQLLWLEADELEALRQAIKNDPRGRVEATRPYVGALERLLHGGNKVAEKLWKMYRQQEQEDREAAIARARREAAGWPLAAPAASGPRPGGS